jgi:hypothetical protein
MNDSHKTGLPITLPSSSTLLDEQHQNKIEENNMNQDARKRKLEEQKKMLEEDSLQLWLDKNPTKTNNGLQRATSQSDNRGSSQPTNVTSQGEELYDWLSELFFLFTEEQLFKEYERLISFMHASHYYDNVLPHLGLLTELSNTHVPHYLDLKRVLMRLTIVANLHLLTDPTPWNNPPAVRMSSRMRELMPLIKCVILSYMNHTKFPPEEFGLAMYPVAIQNPSQAHAVIAMLVARTQAKPLPVHLQTATLKERRACVDEALNAHHFLIQPELYADQQHRYTKFPWRRNSEPSIYVDAIEDIVPPPTTTATSAPHKKHRLMALHLNPPDEADEEL